MLIKDFFGNEFEELEKCLDGMDQTAQTDTEKELAKAMRGLVNGLASIDHDDNPQADIIELLESHDSFAQDMRQALSRRSNILEDVSRQMSLNCIKEMKEDGVSAKRCYKIMTSRAVRAGLKNREEMMQVGVPDDLMEELDRNGEKQVRELKKMIKEQVEEVYGVRVGKKKKRRK